LLPSLLDGWRSFDLVGESVPDGCAATRRSKRLHAALEVPKPASIAAPVGKVLVTFLPSGW
jgi:hypothetical protein